jgi:acyl-CoA synthetase (AMP-forming)/AMP-acid ligase II
MATFFDYLRFQAASNPNAPVIVHPRGVVEYRQLLKGSLAAASHIVGNGFKQGDILALRVQQPELHCCMIIGAMLTGVATVSLGARGARADDIGAAAFVYDDKPDGDWARPFQISQSWVKTENPEGKKALTTPPRDCVSRIIYTSGTTGATKAVPFTEEQLLARVWAQVVGLRPPLGPSRSLSMMGLMSGAGFTNMMLTFMTGGALFLGFESANAPLSLALYNLDRLMASPMQLMKFVRLLREKRVNLPSLKSLVVGGSRLSPQLARQAQTEVCRNLICLYGSTEMGVVATAPAEAIVNHEGAAGYIVPGVTVEVVDANHMPLGPNKEGLIRIRVPNAPTRYANDTEASRTAFRDGWFYPGDVGRVSEDGLLSLAGRESERLNAAGVKVAPSVIEDVVMDWPGIVDVAAFEHLNDMGMGEIAIAVVPEGKLDQQALAKFCRERLRECGPRRILLVKEVPRNEMGKIDRAGLQRTAKQAFALKAAQTGAQPPT